MPTVSCASARDKARGSAAAVALGKGEVRAAMVGVGVVAAGSLLVRAAVRLCQRILQKLSARRQALYSQVKIAGFAFG